MSDLIERKLAWLHFNREMEVNATADYLSKAPGKKLLEIGGGDGFVAQQLAKLGYDVTSIDLAPRYPQLHPVVPGDATKLAFADGTFDVVYTCHVLEEIHDIPLAFQEMQRVLKPNGIAVHVVASSSWAVLSTMWHFAMLPGALFNFITGRKPETFSQTSFAKTGNEDATPEEASSGKIKRRLRWMFLHPVGAHPTFVHEMLFFSVASWKRVLGKRGFNVTAIKRGPLMQSGFRVFPFKAMGLRKALAPMFAGSVCVLASPAQR